MEIIDRHRRATAAARIALARLRPVDLGLPTPCAGWDLRDLLEHMTGQDHGFAAAVRAGSTADVDAGAFAALPLGPDPARTSAAAADDLVAAFAEAAADPGRSVWLPEFGRRFPLEQVAGFHLIDTLVHGWDVAVTLGIALDYDDDLVAAGLEQAERVPDGEFREQPGSPFARALADTGGSDPWERTLALLGRDPTWSPYRASGAL
ncbi:TIGR03086 family metal-binding protein [Pseudonocardia aurantiaca]|uniref:TIGR03086 family metal-binding protein n=1 Tax=Pseudonocardia aurantiaca TaxID=75290 RepID=A0ABW4FVG8_9PSEU